METFYEPIQDYALISDCHTAALVGKNGSIDWLCPERFDNHSVMGALLDEKRGGHFYLRPSGDFNVERCYEVDSMVLTSFYEVATGTLEVRDFMAVKADSKVKGGVRSMSQIVRMVRCMQGEVEVEVGYEPKYVYGGLMPGLVWDEDSVECWQHGVKLRFESSIPVWGAGCEAKGHKTLRMGDTEVIRLMWGDNPEAKDSTALLRDTTMFWLKWINSSKYSGEWEREVKRSALILKSLTYAPTGAIVTSPSCSLPEIVGGDRNWDDRYSWLRDGSLAMKSLARLGFIYEVSEFLTWICNAVDKSGIRCLYKIDGSPLDEEVAIGLDGYFSSRPVRISNAARDQFQLDVFGEVLDLAKIYVTQGGVLDGTHKRVLFALAEAARQHWESPDAGIWQQRDGDKHYTFSKVMAWVALDRALKLGLGEDEETHKQWALAATKIRVLIEDKGVDAPSNSLRLTLEGGIGDSSNLLALLFDFWEVKEARMRATVLATETELMEGGLLLRKRKATKEEDSEGAFILGNFWLVECWTKMNRVREAKTLVGRLLTTQNDVGLWGSMIDLKTGEPRGNFPHIFSHSGLIDAVLGLSKVPPPAVVPLVERSINTIPR